MRRQQGSLPPFQLIMNARNIGTRIKLFAPVACLFCVTLGGCSSEPFPLVRVEGKITYDDGELIPVDSLMIRFVPQTPPLDEKTHARPGTTFTDQDGNFSRVTTHKANDGIVRGRHKVLVKATPETVPKFYMRIEETPLEVDTADAPFHIRVQRPKK
jgi:hypothetical protein